MTSEHLLSFDRVWRNEKWREIQASISLFKFLIMEVSLSLNGWSIWVFFFFLMVFCVIVYLCWREEMIWSTRKLRFDFEATNVLCCPLGRYAEKVMAIMQTYGDGQTGGGGCQKAALQDWLVQANKADFLLWFWSFSRQRWSCLQPMPPLPFATSLKLVHSFFYYSSIVLLKETP